MRTVILSSLFTALVFAQQPNLPPAEPLYPNGAPNAVGSEDVDKPSITPYIPAKPNGQAVVVFPGGGYRGLAADHEGVQIARFLNSQGITAYVVKYRLGPRYHHPSMLNDAQRAVRIARSRASASTYSATRIGVMGFSAGGHLASSVGTHYDAGNPQASDPIDRLSCRPDFLILVYPVISFTDYSHEGSKKNLLGDNPPQDLVNLMSSEKQVTKDTPPTFLFHTNADTVVPPENSVLFYMALRKAGVPAELHIYERGPHGIGLSPTDYANATWPARLTDWLRNR